MVRRPLGVQCKACEKGKTGTVNIPRSSAKHCQVHSAARCTDFLFRRSKRLINNPPLGALLQYCEAGSTDIKGICLKCPAGTFMGHNGSMANCSECELGQYQELEGQVRIECPNTLQSESFSVD